MGSPEGVWHLDVEISTDDHERISIDVRGNPGGPLVSWIATVTSDSGHFETVENIQWVDLPTAASPNRASFSFVRTSFPAPFMRIVDVVEGWVVDGIFVGRFSRTGGLVSAGGAITGWNQDDVDGTALTPRVYEIVIPQLFLVPTTRHTLRILDQDQAGVFTATIKNLDGDSLEYDVTIKRWNGRVLEFSYGTQTFQGIVEGRRVAGAVLPSRMAWRGARTEVLTTGLHPSADPVQMRRRIQHLIMGENPTPVPSPLSSTKLLPPDFPMPRTSPGAGRDDDPTRSPAKDQQYAVWDVTLSYTLTDPRTGGSSSRIIRGYLTKPTTPKPAPGWPAVVVVNGHGGGAKTMMNPNAAQWWYGDAFACRPYVVFAMDVGHRPLADRGTPPLHQDGSAGTHPDHPAIRFNNDDPMWSEDGERAWDAIRVLEFLSGLGPADTTDVVASVDKTRIIVAGLSMGGEVAAYAAAMDERFKAAVSVGFGRDYAEYFQMTNKRSAASCMQWTHANVIEYLNVSDLHALVATRPLLAVASITEVESTRCKQVFRRSLAAYSASAAPFIHYFHDDGHTFRWGSVSSTTALPPGSRRTTMYIQTPKYPGPASPPPTGNWQTNNQTTILPLPVAGAPPGDLYDWLRYFGF